MSNSMKYKGYHAAIEYSSEDGMLIGSVIGIQDSLNFHGTTIDEITQAFHDSIDGYLEMCEALGRSPDKEYKGSFNVRIAPDLHRQAAIAAECSGMTLNQFVQQAIEDKLNPDPYKSVVVFLPATSQKAMVKAEKNVYTGSRYRSEPSASVLIGG